MTITNRVLRKWHPVSSEARSKKILPLPCRTCMLGETNVLHKELDDLEAGMM